MSTEHRNAITGLVGLVALVVLGFFVYLYLGGFFRPGFEVTGTFERAGQLLRTGSDVKLRGVLVGEVTDIRVTDEGQARVGMRIFPDQDIPRNVHAAIRAKTLFGEKFVELGLPEDPAPMTLAQGDHIPEERTTGPFEVETIMEQTVPLLSAIDPEMFGAALQALAQGFVGNEEALRRATLQGEQALTQTAGTLPQLERNIRHLRDFAHAMDRADDDLLRALDGFEQAGGVIVRRPNELRTVLGAVASLGRDLSDILEAREGDLGDLASQGAVVLETVAEIAPDLPRIVQLLDGFLGTWILNLTQGPHWRILFTSELALDTHPYPPGTQPQPRSAEAAAARTDLLRRIAGEAEEPAPGLTDILLSPVPDEEIGSMLDRLPVTRRLGDER